MKYFLIGLMAVVLVACGGDSKTPPSDNSAAISALQSQLPTLSGDYVWAMNSEASSLTFEAFYNGNFNASFEQFATAIQLDPENPQNGEIHAAVKLESVQSKNDDVKANALQPDWFNAEQFPVALFSSKQIENLGGSNYAASGDITLKGITRPAKLVFSLNVTGNKAVADGGFELNRRDFNVGTGSDFQDESWVKFPVTVRVHIEANR